MALNRRRELPGFGLPMESYEKAEAMIALDRKHLRLGSDVTMSQYLESILRDAIDQRKAGLEAIDRKSRLVLSPDEP